MDLDKILDRLGRLLDAMVANPASSDEPHTEYVLPVWAETAVLFTVSFSGAVFLCFVGCLTLTDTGRQHMQESTARYETTGGPATRQRRGLPATLQERPGASVRRVW